MEQHELQPGQLDNLHHLFAFDEAENITSATLLYDADQLARQLPDHRYVINLCNNRYNFCVAFLAAILRKQVNLLPSNRQPGGLNEIRADYPDCYYLYDDEASSISLHGIKVEPGRNRKTTVQIPEIPDDQTICIAFTSGTTGKPKPNHKTWKTLSIATKLALKRFNLESDTTRHIVCTVPPQHMYGLETSVFYPLLGNAAVYMGKPFFPEDIRSALESATGGRILITTPIHLKACVNAGLDWPEVDTIISATAPLSRDLAATAEKVMQAEVKEIFGFTEAGSVASRRTLTDDRWTLYDGMTLSSENDQQLLTGPQLNQAVKILDQIEMTSVNSFRLQGRHSDMVNIAGKRASLAELNQKLNSIPGVIDGVYLQQQDDNENTRLSALVVAPLANEKDILNALREILDPVFLPRPLLKVQELPRNETGKLPETELLQCFQQACTA